MATYLRYAQSIKVEEGETLTLQVMMYCFAYNSGTYFIELYDETNGASLAKTSLTETTTEFLAFQASARIPAGCEEVRMRWGMEDGALDGTYCVFDIIRVWRGSDVRVAE